MKRAFITPVTQDNYCCCADVGQLATLLYQEKEVFTQQRLN